MGDVIANLLVIFSEISLFRIRDDLHFENSRRTSPLLDPWPVNHWQWYYARANYARANYGIIEHIISGIAVPGPTICMRCFVCDPLEVPLLSARKITAHQLGHCACWQQALDRPKTRAPIGDVHMDTLCLQRLAIYSRMAKTFADFHTFKSLR